MIESHDDLPGPEIWLLAPRASSPLTESVYSLASALHTVSLQQLAQVASTRYTVEQGIEKAKVDAGFECYEVQM